MRAARNIAIIMLLALVVAAVPGGGGLADGIIAAITVSFLAIIGAIGYLAYRQNRLTFISLPDQSRTIVLAAVGGIVVAFAGADDLFDTSAGVLVFVAVVGLSIGGLVRVVTEARSY